MASSPEDSRIMDALLVSEMRADLVRGAAMRSADCCSGGFGRGARFPLRGCYRDSARRLALRHKGKRFRLTSPAVTAQHSPARAHTDTHISLTGFITEPVNIAPLRPCSLRTQRCSAEAMALATVSDFLRRARYNLHSLFRIHDAGG